MNMIRKNLSVEDARIGFRNFSGKEGKFNPKGKRNFCVFLDKENAEDLNKDGWNIRWLEPRNPDDERQAYLQVAVSFEHFPPKILLITSHNKTELSEDNIDILDWAEIERVDLIIRPYNWKLDSGKEGVKAYAKAMYITIVEDEFEAKYRDVPDSASAVLDDQAPPWDQ